MTEAAYLKHLGKVISKKRESLGFSREELADKIKLSRMHVYRIENGTNPTTITVLRRIAKELGLKLSELVDIS